MIKTKRPTQTVLRSRSKREQKSYWDGWRAAYTLLKSKRKDDDPVEEVLRIMSVIEEVGDGDSGPSFNRREKQ
jgi:hypothetical protein